jgi:hypothetical protein
MLLKRISEEASFIFVCDGEQIQTNEQDRSDLQQIGTKLTGIALRVKEFSLFVLVLTKKRAGFWTGPFAFLA